MALSCANNIEMKKKVWTKTKTIEVQVSVNLKTDAASVAHGLE